MTRSLDHLREIALAVGLDEDALAALLEPAWSGEPVIADLLRVGYLPPFRILEDGRLCGILPLIGIDMIAVDINPWGHNDAYYYRAGGAAARALEAWDGSGEPAGWFRHPQSGRRREDGDPARETIRY